MYITYIVYVSLLTNIEEYDQYFYINNGLCVYLENGHNNEATDKYLSLFSLYVFWPQPAIKKQIHCSLNVTTIKVCSYMNSNIFPSSSRRPSAELQYWGE